VNTKFHSLFIFLIVVVLWPATVVSENQVWFTLSFSRGATTVSAIILCWTVSVMHSVCNALSYIHEQLQRQQLIC